jgi:uncharacterized protein (DUF885 family)
MKHVWTVVAVLLITFSAPVASAATEGEFDFEAWKDRVAREASVEGVARLYLEIMLEDEPTGAASYGIHSKGGDPTYYDDRMGRPSAEAWARSYEARRLLLERLESMDAGSLDRADQIDRHIMITRLELAILQQTRLDTITNPLTYTSRLGDAFSDLVIRDFAPLPRRLQSFARRCAATGEFLDAARSSLLPPYIQPTAVQKQVAMGRLQGMVGPDGLFEKALPDLLEAAELSDNETGAIREACDFAVEQIKAFTAWFEAAILPRPDGPWRIGPELYAAKYALQMDYPLGPEALLARAEAALEETHARLVRVAREIHDQYLAEGIAAGDIQKADTLDDSQVVRNVFALLAEDRSTPDSLIADSYAMADAIVGFVQDKDLLDLPPTSKMRIEDVPPHLAGYAVAQIQTAPPFEPELESIWFWDLGLLATSDSYLKEYNRPTLAMVYIHEGVPGHFVQQEYSNRFERLVPKIFRNGPMVEGWATYIATQLVAEGFTIYPDHPLGHELQQIVDDKLVLRSIINAIIDIRLHTTDWPEEEAVRLMMEQGFQEEGEARGKLTRAKMSSVQLATYFAGHIAILEILEEYKQAKGPDFSWKAFNQRLVSAGSPPFFVLREEMLE